MFIRFKEIGELETIACLILIFRIRLVANEGSSSSPFVFLTIAITQLHPFIIQTTAFRKSLDEKVCLPFYSLYCKVKPDVFTPRIGLLVQTDSETVNPDQLDFADVP